MLLRVIAYGTALFMVVISVGYVYVGNLGGRHNNPFEDTLLLYLMAIGVFCAVSLVLLFHIYAAAAAIRDSILGKRDVAP